jgi:recombination associated protein RdgC
MLINTAKVYFYNDLSFDNLTLNDKLMPFKHTPITQHQAISIGFISPFGKNSDMLFSSIEGAYLFYFFIETKTVDASYIKEQIESFIDEKRKEDPDFKLSRQDKNELKEKIINEALPNILPKSKTIPVIVDTENKQIIFGNKSPKFIEQILILFARAFGEFEYTEFSKNEAEKILNSWIVDKDLPERFTLGYNCKLVNSHEKDTVMYRNHDLEEDKVMEYIANGYDTKQISVCWNDVLDLTVSSDLTLSGFKNSDSKEEPDNDDPHVVFEAEFAYNLAILRGFLPSLINAFR